MATGHKHNLFLYGVVNRQVIAMKEWGDYELGSRGSGSNSILQMLIEVMLLPVSEVVCPSDQNNASQLTTSDAIISLIDSVLTALDQGDVACGLFCDLRRAFDCVDQELLLNTVSWNNMVLEEFLINGSKDF
ncbi:hypothetical protein J6590_003322 [Homalodisca vitripennis]|nr:hypothetical protein J6590_003322 [Homalodisca vitripennis]